jgi:hypothetical protein
MVSQFTLKIKKIAPTPIQKGKELQFISHDDRELLKGLLKSLPSSC